MALSLTHQGKLHFVQWHHIFPKSLLKNKGFERGAINEIANMAFITGQTNRRIGNKDAATYLAAVVDKQGEEALTAQCVPLIVVTYGRSRIIRDFLAQRRSDLCARMNQFIEGKSGRALS